MSGEVQQITPAEVDLVKAFLLFITTAVGGAVTVGIRELRGARKRRELAAQKAKRDTDVAIVAAVAEAEARAAGIALREKEAAESAAMRLRVVESVTTLGNAVETLTDTLQKIDAKVDRLGKEIIINGGTTTIGTVTLEMRDRVAALNDIVATLDSQLRLETAARQIGEDKAVWEDHLGIDGTIVPFKVSDTWKLLTGLDRDQTQDGEWLRCVAAEDVQRVQAIVAQASRAQQMVEVEYVCVNVITKTRCRVRHTARPVWDSKGKLIGWVGLLVPLA